MCSKITKSLKVSLKPVKVSIHCMAVKVLLQSTKITLVKGLPVFIFFSELFHQVKWAEQQKILHRVKRDGIPTDPKFKEMWYLVSTLNKT